MKQRYRRILRGERSSNLYRMDMLTSKRASLLTFDLDEARQIVLINNQGLRQPALNRQSAKVCLADSDSVDATRIRQQAMVVPEQGENERRWQTAINDISSNRLSSRLR